MVHTIGISEMIVTRAIDDELITYSLGSCAGLSLYDSVLRVGGLIHCLLPLSKMDKEKAVATPCMFTDTGVIVLLKAMYAQGCDRKNIVAKIAGGAAPLNGPKAFRVGERNIVVLRKTLWKNSIRIAAEDVGGTKARTMKLTMSTGATTLKSGRIEVEL